MPNLGPATDFYKKMSLDFSGQQIAADLFLLGAQYQDIATLGKTVRCIPFVSNLLVPHLKNYAVRVAHTESHDRLWRVATSYRK